MTAQGQTNHDQDRKKGISSYFSTQTKAWKDYYELDGSGRDGTLKLEIIKRKEIVFKLLDKYGSNDVMKILDVGCGSGVFLKELLLQGHKVVGSDISEAMIQEAMKGSAEFPLDNKSFIIGDIENMSFTNNTFDAILGIGVLQFQKRDEKSICEISRVLKNTGLAIVSIPNLFRINMFFDPYYYINFFPKFSKKIYRIFIPGKIDPIKDFKLNRSFMVKKYFYRQLNKIFRLYHLEPVEYISVGYGPPTIWQRNIISDKMAIKFSNYTENLSYSNQFSFLNWFPNRWVICLKKNSAVN